MLSHLIYSSTRASHCTEQEIEKILASCYKNNKDIEVTGVLLYSDHQFIQYLEGEYSRISALYDKIKRDNRHKYVVIVSSGPIEERLFPSWQMGHKQVNLDSVKFKTAMDEAEQKHFNEMLTNAEPGKALSLIKKFFW